MLNGARMALSRDRLETELAGRRYSSNCGWPFTVPSRFNSK